MSRTNKRVLAVVLIAGLLVFYVASVFVSFIVGGVLGNGQVYQNRFREEEPDMRAVLRGDPQFANVRITRTSLGYAQLSGEVPSREAYARLQERVERLFGQKHARMRTACVEVKSL
jgi:hypothetical protein